MSNDTLPLKVVLDDFEQLRAAWQADHEKLELEIEHLTAERDHWKRDHEYQHKLIDGFAAANKRLIAERDAALRDAEQYRSHFPRIMELARERERVIIEESGDE